MSPTFYYGFAVNDWLSSFKLRVGGPSRQRVGFLFPRFSFFILLSGTFGLFQRHNNLRN